MSFPAMKRSSRAILSILLTLSSFNLPTTMAFNASRMPDGSWDSHIHIVDPTRYPLSENATYTPSVFTAWDNVLYESSIGADHNTIIQPSIYGYDNRCLLDALKAYGPDRARAVVVFDPDNTDAAELERWDKLGVRGVRANLQFTENPSTDQIKDMLQKYADAVRPFDWAVQVAIDMNVTAQLADFLPSLDVTLVFDHFGYPNVPDTPKGKKPDYDPYEIDGFQTIVDLLKAGKTWVKISAAYRLSKTGAPDYIDMDPVLKEYVKVANDRVVWATDWPHVMKEDTDVHPWTGHLLDLFEDDPETTQRLFKDNARALWGADTEPSK